MSLLAVVLSYCLQTSNCYPVGDTLYVCGQLSASGAPIRRVRIGRLTIIVNDDCRTA